MKRPIELLCPAKNLECGLEAIRHGADAVYIGGPTHGARAAAGNSLEDIRTLCDYAHIFGARVYVTVNTIVYEEELQAVENLIAQLYEIGVDALITQDRALLKMNIPPIALHASTQIDTRTAEKAVQLEREGYSQIVLARELSLEEIRAIHEKVNVPLEGFIHGALCVSYSGKCFVSEHCFSRSANRGECSQFCRMSFDLVDAKNDVVVKDKHLLSMKDMNRADSIEEMLDAGISSFKIEGRLKDVAYVKNLTAFYRKEIDKVLARRSGEYVRASYGKSVTGFTPQAEKSFNRGFTDYFLYGRKANIFSFDTPKAIGEPIGTVAHIGKRSVTVKLEEGKRLSAGDGLCFKASDGQLVGFRVNRVEGNEIIPLSIPPLVRGIRLFRNLDHEFDKQLKKATAVRKLEVTALLNETPDGYSLSLTDETGLGVEMDFPCEKQEARTSQSENIKRQLSKTGDTPFSVTEVVVETENERFIPSSLLGEWRRMVCEALLVKRRSVHVREERKRAEKVDFSGKVFDFSENVSNSLAREYYLEHGASEVQPAFELKHVEHTTLMTCRHCIRYALGYCPTYHKKKAPWQEPLRLRLGTGETFPLVFDCKHCEMQVRSE